MKGLKVLKYIAIITICLFLHMIFMNPPARIYKTNVFKEIESNALIADFNSELNSRYWNVIERGDNCNNELQYYSPKNVNIKNGFLEIEARKKVINEHQYTSGLIDTKNKYEFLYGKVIFRAKPASNPVIRSSNSFFVCV